MKIDPSADTDKFGTSEPSTSEPETAAEPEPARTVTRQTTRGSWKPGRSPVAELSASGK